MIKTAGIKKSIRFFDARRFNSKFYDSFRKISNFRFASVTV